MRKLLLAVSALLAVAFTSPAPASAGTHMERSHASVQKKMHHRRHAQRHAHRHHRHHHRHHHMAYGYRMVQPYYATRVYEIPRYAYRPYYYTAWSYPYQGVYVMPRGYYARRHW